MQSHGDMVPPNSDIVVAEPLLECSQYLKLLRQTFEQCNQFQISWDPSTYSGDDVMVCAVWSNQCNTAAYLPIQYVQPIETTELDVEFKVLAQRKQITRVEGYNELRAVAHAMTAVGKDFDMFEVQSDVLWKPLQKEEKRAFKDGQFWIVNTITGASAKQIPDGWTFQSQHSLVSISDQGGINRGVLDYAQYMLPLSLVVGYDGQHRTWNDLKASLRASGLFRTFLGMAIIFNVGYGPAGSKTWWGKKVAALKAFAANRNCNEEPFLGYMANICQERGEEEDGSERQRRNMWNAMLNMKGAQVHGPLTKLMRWYSWWESYQFHHGELWFTRLLMLYGNTAEPVDQDGQVDSTMFDPNTEGMTPQQELRYLKMKLGCWALAPALVNKQNLWQATLIFEGGRTLWTSYTKMAKNVKTAEQVQNHLVEMVAGGWRAELAHSVKHCLSNVGMMKRLYADPGDVSQEHLVQHWKYICQLVPERALSLVRLAAEGHHIKPLDHMHFLRTAFVRLHFLANELDIKGGLAYEEAHAVVLAQTACKNLGDTVIIENTHQKMKDLMHVARHDQVGRLSKLHSMINAGVLEGRGLPTLKVSDEDKVFASASRQGVIKIRQATHPNSLKVKKQYQNVMKYKASSPGFTWPSSSHASLFLALRQQFVFILCCCVSLAWELKLFLCGSPSWPITGGLRFGEAAAFEMLLGLGPSMNPEEFEGPSIICLVGKPGCFVACRETSSVLMVVAQAANNFLAWGAGVVGQNGDGLLQFELHPAESFSWRTIKGLQGWLALPTIPILKNRFGPMIFQQASEAIDLLQARISEGLCLTNKQCEAVLQHYGQKPTSKKKKDLYMQIFALFLETEEEQQEALKKSSWEGKDEEDEEEDASGGELSDYEDLLEQIEETGNAGDPDLKQEKATLKKSRSKLEYKEALKVVKEAQENRRRARGRGRGRGKGRGKGRGRTPHFPDLVANGDLDALPEAAGSKIEEDERKRKEAEEQAKAEDERMRKEAEEKAKAEEERMRKEAEEQANAGPASSMALVPATTHPRGPNLYETPALLMKLCPPQGRLLLDHNDHRLLPSSCVRFACVQEPKGLFQICMLFCFVF